MIVRFGIKQIGGDGAYHLCEQDRQGERTSLCGIDVQSHGYLWGVEGALRFAKIKKIGLCKRCVKIAQKHRNPLDRIAEL